MNWQTNYPLGQRTRFGVGGNADFFFRARTEQDLLAHVRFCVEKKFPFVVIGGGTNLLIADSGVRGYVIENAVSTITQIGTRLTVAAGTVLNDFVNTANRQGFAGMESMAGIPGTLGGAIVGNAGAYGQEIRDIVERVRIFDGRSIRTLTNAACRFRYRSSIFKTKSWVLLDTTLRFHKDSPIALKKRSRVIRILRNKKFPPTLRCPGSYFKNILLRELPTRTRTKLEKTFPDKIMHGKLPSAVLLDAVGMRGKRHGGIRIAPYHANLFFNAGHGTAADVCALAATACQAVLEAYRVELDEEVRLLG